MKSVTYQAGLFSVGRQIGWVHWSLLYVLNGFFGLNVISQELGTSYVVQIPAVGLEGECCSMYLLLIMLSKSHFKSKRKVIKCVKINIYILSHCTDPYENELIFPSKMTNYTRLFNSFFCDTKEHNSFKRSPFAFGVIKSILRGFVSRGCAA